MGWEGINQFVNVVVDMVYVEVIELYEFIFIEYIILVGILEKFWKCDKGMVLVIGVSFQYCFEFSNNLVQMKFYLFFGVSQKIVICILYVVCFVCKGVSMSGKNLNCYFIFCD